MKIRSFVHTDPVTASEGEYRYEDDLYIGFFINGELHIPPPKNPRRLDQRTVSNLFEAGFVEVVTASLKTKKKEV